MYNIISVLDNSNYSNDTVWLQHSEADPKLKAIHASAQVNNQYISEADNLVGIPTESYGAILSSHVLEHIANPLGALMEWKRVMKTGGYLILVVPHKEGTFDHRRPLTSLDHLVMDFEENAGPDDKTHIQEVLELHDLALDPGVRDYEELKSRAGNNEENRCLHHHVFDTQLVEDAVGKAGFELLHSEF